MINQVKTYEEFKQDLNEGLHSFIKKSLDKGSEFAHDVWNATKRESRETQEAVRILNMLIKGEVVSDTQKKFLRAQSIDLIKVIPIVAISGIPIPIPITPLLILLGKKVGFDILPNSHTKVDYQI